MKTLLILIILISSSLSAQPELDIRPGSMEFEDIFHRLENVYFINRGDMRLQIDSIRYRNDHYYLRFYNGYQVPFFIEPGDSLLMDCILAGYLFVPAADTVDTMFVYSNSRTGVEDVRIKIDFYDDNYDESEITGRITSSGIPVADAEVYVFAEGTIIVDSAYTDEFGNYSFSLYPGNYLLAAAAENHYLTFYNGKPDPFTADWVQLPENASVTADIDIVPSTATSYSVSGRLYDTLYNAPLKKAVVVVKKGTHTPGKKNNLNFDGGIYSAITGYDGSFSVHNIMTPDYYYMQAFSSYYVPGYYNQSNTPAVFWQNADTLLINSALINRDIYMIRDSSFGGGKTYGAAVVQNRNVLYDVMVYAQPVNSSNIYSSGMGRDSGSFTINYLPYGTYNLIGQKAGLENAYYGPVIIDSINTDSSGILLIFNSLSSEGEVLSPQQFELKQNFPNPFNPATTFEIIIPEQSRISLKIFNILGELVAELFSGQLNEGKYTYHFDASALSSGTYIAVLNNGTVSLSRKILLLK